MLQKAFSAVKWDFHLEKHFSWACSLNRSPRWLALPSPQISNQRTFLDCSHCSLPGTTRLSLLPPIHPAHAIELWCQWTWCCAWLTPGLTPSCPRTQFAKGCIRLLVYRHWKRIKRKRKPWNNVRSAKVICRIYRREKKNEVRERTTSYNQQLVTAEVSGLSNFLWVEQSFITWVSDVLCLQRAHSESSYPSFSLINASEIGNPGISLISVGRKEAAAQRDHGIHVDGPINKVLELKAKFLDNKGVATRIPEELIAPGSWEQFQFLRFAGPTSGQISCSGKRVKGWRQRCRFPSFCHVLISTVTSAWLQFWCVWPKSYYHKPLMERLLYIENGIGSGDTWRHKPWP